MKTPVENLSAQELRARGRKEIRRIVEESYHNAGMPPEAIARQRLLYQIFDGKIKQGQTAAQIRDEWAGKSPQQIIRKHNRSLLSRLGDWCDDIRARKPAAKGNHPLNMILATATVGSIKTRAGGNKTANTKTVEAALLDADGNETPEKITLTILTPPHITNNGHFFFRLRFAEKEKERPVYTAYCAAQRANGEKPILFEGSRKADEVAFDESGLEQEPPGDIALDSLTVWLLP